MRTIYKHQTTGFTCGVTALQNCLAQLDHIVSEAQIRDYAHTTKNGTSQTGLINAIKKLGYKYRIIRNVNYTPFAEKLKRHLKAEHSIILLTDHEEHWVSIINYTDKKFYVIDPQRGEPLNKFFTTKELQPWCNNFDKKNKTCYYLAISLWKK